MRQIYIFGFSEEVVFQNAGQFTSFCLTTELSTSDPNTKYLPKNGIYLCDPKELGECRILSCHLSLSLRSF